MSHQRQCPASGDGERGVAGLPADAVGVGHGGELRAHAELLQHRRGSVSAPSSARRTGSRRSPRRTGRRRARRAPRARAVSCSNGVSALRSPARSMRSSSIIASRAVQPIRGVPASTSVSAADDLVEEGVLADPAGGALLQTRGEHGAPGLGGEHHDFGAGGAQRGDEVDAAADAVAEVDVEQHALGLEPPGVLDHGGRRRAVGGLDLPAACRQRQLETDRHQGVVLDDEHPPGHGHSTRRKRSTNVVPPPGRGGRRSTRPAQPSPAGRCTGRARTAAVTRRARRARTCARTAAGMPLPRSSTKTRPRHHSTTRPAPRPVTRERDGERCRAGPRRPAPCCRGRPRP